MRPRPLIIGLTVAVVALVAAIAIISGSDSQVQEESLSSLDLHWGGPRLDSATEKYFHRLQRHLKQERKQEVQYRQEQRDARATDVLQLAPPQQAQARENHMNDIVQGAGVRSVVNGNEGQQLAQLNDDDDHDDEGASHHDAHRQQQPSWAQGTNSDMYNLAEARLNDDQGPLAKESSSPQSVSRLSVQTLEQRLAADRKREQQDQLELAHASAQAGVSTQNIRHRIMSLASKAAKNKKPAPASSSSSSHPGAVAAFRGAMKQPSHSNSNNNKKSGDSEVDKTAALMKSVSKILGHHHVPKHAYIRPMSTALVARELGDAIDKHERCRRRREVAEHHLMAVEEKAKTAMREARDADAGMAKALGMVKRAEDLVEKAREEHEDYVQDVRDSLDVRSQYTTEAMEAHTLLEHMTRLKKRYDRAVQVLTRDQVKYNKMLRKVEHKTDQQDNMKQSVNDERAELHVLSGDNDEDNAGITLDASNPQEEALAQEAANIVDPVSASNAGETRLQRLESNAHVLGARAQAVLSSLPAVEMQARKEKQLVQKDQQMLIEAENDRVLSKNRLEEGDLSKAQHVKLGETVERDQQHIINLRMGLQRARAELRADRRTETLGPRLQREARAAMHEARTDASRVVTRQFKHTFNVFGLGSMLASAVSPDLAEKVVAQIMGSAVSTQKLQQQFLTNSEMLAQDSQAVIALRAEARQLRSEMKIKRQIANDARKDYEIARNQWEHASRKVQPLSEQLHDRSKGILESRQNAEVALEKAQQHLISTRRTARFAASAKLQADRYLRRVRKTLYEKQEVVKNLAQCQRGAWFKIKDLTDTAKLHNIIGDGQSDMDWTSPSDLMKSAA